MPWRCAGSETVIHELMKAAHHAGHHTVSWCTNRDSDKLWTGREPDTLLDGVLVRRARNIVQASNQVFGWKPDVVVSHHQHAAHAIRLARRWPGVRSVLLTHNDMDINQRPLQLGPDLVVHNSRWVAESLARFGTPRSSLVFHPPVTPDRHRVDATGDGVTLVNLNEHKGAHLFYALAEAMPDTRFVGVVGGHGVQIIRRNLPNVTIVEHTPDMRTVWAQTRVLLMPSIYESYGLVAQEAGLNGIPTVANPTPGLVENIGTGGLFCDRDKLEEWVTTLRGLDNPTTYAAASAYARNRADAAMVETRDTLNQWCDWLDG